MRTPKPEQDRALFSRSHQLLAGRPQQSLFVAAPGACLLLHLLQLNSKVLASTRSLPIKSITTLPLHTLLPRIIAPHLTRPPMRICIYKIDDQVAVEVR